MNNQASLKRISIIIIVLIGAIFLSILLVLNQKNTIDGLYTAQYVFPVIAILAILASILTLAFVSIVFASFQQQPSLHALGMPPGSIRALIALALLTSFVIIAVFLFSSLNEQKSFRQNNVTPEQLKSLNVKDYRVVDTTKVLISTNPILDTATGRQAIDVETNKPKLLNIYSNKSYDIDIFIPANEQASDFARQLLTVLGTLVIAVCSFYFGSRSTEQGSALTSEIINGTLANSAHGNTTDVNEEIVQEAINKNKINWINYYKVKDIKVGKKKVGPTTNNVNCITFIVESKEILPPEAKLIPAYITFQSQDGRIYSIPTDVVPLAPIQNPIQAGPPEPDVPQPRA